MMNEDSAMLSAIYRAMNGKVFGYRTAASIVGGRARLDQLIIEGKIRAEKPTAAQNGKWRCNAADGLRNTRI
jgi:hypothetical protein